jgi:GH43 family beta-xylosidase
LAKAPAERTPEGRPAIGIYRSLSDIKRNPLYDAEAISRLEVFFATKDGLMQAGQNNLAVADRSQRMIDLGVPDDRNL